MSIIYRQKKIFLATALALVLAGAALWTFFFNNSPATIHVWIEDDVSFWKVAGDLTEKAAADLNIPLHITYFKGGTALDPQIFRSAQKNIDLIIAEGLTLGELADLSSLKDTRLPKTLIQADAPLRFKDALMPAQQTTPIALPLFAGRVSWLMANHPVNPPPPSWLELLVSPDPTNVAAPFARVGRFVAVLPSDNSSLLLNMAYQFGVLNFSAPQTNQPPRIEWDIHKLGEMLDALATAAHKQQNFPIDCRADCFWSALQRKETHFALVEDWMFYTPALVLEKRDFIVMRPHPASTAQRELIHLVGMMPVNNSRAVSKLLANLLDIPSQQAVWQRHGRIPVRTDLNSQATNPLYRDRLEIMENIDLTAWPVALKQRQIDIEKRFFALYRDFIEGRLSLEETLDQARKAFGP